MQKIPGRPGWTLPSSSLLAAAASNVTVSLFFPPFNSWKKGGVFSLLWKSVPIAVRHRQAATRADPSLRAESSYCIFSLGEKTMFQKLSFHCGSISNGKRPDGKCVWNPSCHSDSDTSVKTALVYISFLTSPKPVATWSLRHKICSAVPVSLQHGWKHFFFYKFSSLKIGNLYLQMLLSAKLFPCLPYRHMRSANLLCSQVMPTYVQPNDFPRNTSQKKLTSSFLST